MSLKGKPKFLWGPGRTEDRLKTGLATKTLPATRLKRVRPRPTSGDGGAGAGTGKARRGIGKDIRVTGHQVTGYQDWNHGYPGYKWRGFSRIKEVKKIATEVREGTEGVRDCCFQASVNL